MQFCSYIPVNHTATFLHLSAAPLLQAWLPHATSLIRTNSLCSWWKCFIYFLTTSLITQWLRDEMSWIVHNNRILVDVCGIWEWASLLGKTEHCALQDLLALQRICIYRSLGKKKEEMDFSWNSISFTRMFYDSTCISSTKCPQKQFKLLHLQ